MDNIKYNLSETTEAEREIFMNEFNTLCDKHSLFVSIQPKLEPVKLNNNDGTEKIIWAVTDSLVIQKKTKVEEEPVPSTDIPSTDPEVNPAITDESTKEAE